MPFRIRVAVPADLAATDLLVSRFHQHERIGPAEPVRQGALTALLADGRLGAILLAEEGDWVLGYAAVVYGYSIEFGGRDAFLDELWVEPAHQGQGLGTALLEAACAHAARDGIVAMHLEVDDRNARAQGLYGRLGFTLHDRRLMTRRLVTADGG